MKLDKFMEKHGSKMGHLETIFLRAVFYQDFGEGGLDLIEPEVNISRNDGSDRKWRIDFVIKTKFTKYAVECDGFNYHAPGMVSRERDNELHEKRNETIRQGYVYIELTRDQIEITPEEAVYQLRRSFIADKELYSIFLNRNTGRIAPHEVQQMALDNLTESRDDGKDKGLVVLATGLGKTYLSIFDTIQANASKILFIVHVGEILKKTRNSFEEVMPKRAKEMGFYMGNNKNREKNILFATIQTLTRPKNLSQFDSKEFDYIILDETHHLAAPSYKRVFDHFKPKFFLGLTATPNRMDQQDILGFYNNNLIFEMEQDEAIKKGFLTGIRYIGYKDNVDYSKIYYNGFKYDINDLNKNLMIEERDKSIISKFKELGPNKKTIGFCASTEHADWCAKRFRKEGINAVSIHSNLDNSDLSVDMKDRDKLIEGFEKSKYQVAFVVNMFNEGVDFPDVDCILLLRPTESITILTQQIGRGLRISPGKKEVLILDFIGNYQTAHKILPALGIGNVNELTEVKDKGIYYYDNDGRSVVFDSEVVEIFRMMTSRSTRRVRTELLDKDWIEYGNYLHENTIAGSKLHWKVGNKNDHLNVHMWAIDYLNNNSINKTATEISDDIRKKSQELFPGRTMEGSRALFFSKLLGFVDDGTPIKATEVFNQLKTNNVDLSNVEDYLDIITKQLEKFYFWNDLFSLTNRHVARDEQRPVNEYFHIYPLYFIYEVIIKLKNNYGYDDLTLSKFEIDSFIVLARTHSDLNSIVERIVEYREHKEKYEIEKYLKEKTKLDARYYKTLRYCKYFNYNPKRIIMNADYFEEVERKVKEFTKLITENKLIRFDEKNPKKYRNLLYSTKNLLDYHKD
jgi:superfamily II DNA or RNA helicase